jgi:ribosome maturation factor RimP
MREPMRGLGAEIDRRVTGLGYEVVEIVWAGSRARPILRLRVDRDGLPEGEGVTVDDCARVSRGLEEWLDELDGLPEKYVLEVSSPGVDRPLTRSKHWRRFLGEKVVVRGRKPLAGRSRRLEGELVGYDGQDAEAGQVKLRLSGGEEVEIARGEIDEARLLFEWG